VPRNVLTLSDLPIEVLIGDPPSLLLNTYIPNIAIIPITIYIAYSFNNSVTVSICLDMVFPQSASAGTVVLLGAAVILGATVLLGTAVLLGDAVLLSLGALLNRLLASWLAGHGGIDDFKTYCVISGTFPDDSCICLGLSSIGSLYVDAATDAATDVAVAGAVAGAVAVAGASVRPSITPIFDRANAKTARGTMYLYIFIYIQNKKKLCLSCFLSLVSLFF
jgi:hypothetical protein